MNQQARRLAYASVVVALLLSVGEKRRKKSAPRSTGEESSDMRNACKLGSYHGCHCPAMVAEQWDTADLLCSTAVEKEHSACMLREVKNPCEVVQGPDHDHPEHTCRRNCSKATCKCQDGPPCTGPSLVEGNSESDSR